MESDGGGGLEGALADPRQLVRDLEERVEALENENEELRDEFGERLRKQQETIVAQDKQIGQLQNENEQLRRMLRDVQETAERNWRHRSETAYQRAMIRQRVADVENSCLEHEDIEQFRLEVARLKRRQSDVEAAVQNADVDLEDSLFGDKVTMVRRIGVEAVTDRVTAKKERGELLLENVEDWWSEINTRSRKGWTITRSEAQSRIEAARNESLQPHQVGDEDRVFGWIVELTEDSARDAAIEDVQGATRLYLGVPEGSVDE